MCTKIGGGGTTGGKNLGITWGTTGVPRGNTSGITWGTTGEPREIPRVSRGDHGEIPRVILGGPRGNATVTTLRVSGH